MEGNPSVRDQGFDGTLGDVDVPGHLVGYDAVTSCSVARWPYDQLVGDRSHPVDPRGCSLRRDQLYVDLDMSLQSHRSCVCRNLDVGRIDFWVPVEFTDGVLQTSGTA